MKKTEIIIILLFLSISCLHVNLKAQDTYYWYKGDRINLYSIEESDYGTDSLFIFRHEKGNTVALSTLFYVKLRNEDDLNILHEQTQKNRVIIKHQNRYMPLWYALEITAESGGNALQMANKFYETGLFAASEPEFKYRDIMHCVNDSLFELQWGLKNTGQYCNTPGYDINFCAAHELTEGDPNIIVAIIDNGVQTDHPEWHNLYYNYDIASHSISNSFFNDHGTNVAGIIGSKTNNMYGVAGIAPKCTLMSIGVNTDYNNNYLKEQLADALNYAWRNGASVINNSWAGHELASELIDEAICNALEFGRNGKGCIVVFSSGNTYTDNTDILYPANLNPELLVVGGIMPEGKRFVSNGCANTHPISSCYGDKLDIVAPGVSIPTLKPTNGYTSTFSGTSAAAPHVSAVAALILSVNPDLSQRIVCNIIELTAKKNRTDYYTYSNHLTRPNGTWNKEMGYGLIDAYEAVRLAQIASVDLFTADNYADNGNEPTSNPGLGVTNSPDLWLRVSDDGGSTHQMGVIGATNYMYARVRNRGSVTSSGADTLKVYTKHAGLSVDLWPDGWTLSGKAPIPPIQTHSDRIMSVPIVYTDSGVVPFGEYHCAALTWIESSDEMHPTTPTVPSAINQVISYNNASYKNCIFFSPTAIDSNFNRSAIIPIQNNRDSSLIVNLSFTEDTSDSVTRISHSDGIRLCLPSEMTIYNITDRDNHFNSTLLNNGTAIPVSQNFTLSGLVLPPGFSSWLRIDANNQSREFGDPTQHNYIVTLTDNNGSFLDEVTIIMNDSTQCELFSTTVGNNCESQSISPTLINSLAPNPAHNEIDITYHLAANANDAKIIIMNLNGTIIYEAQLSVNSTRLNINLQTLTPGRYLAILMKNGLRADVKLFSKQ